MKLTIRPNLQDYDLILLNSSAGKDSLAMIDEMVLEGTRQGIPRHRFYVVHADLGRAEWAGTRELAEQQARHYGLRFTVVARDQDLLDHIEQRGMFPSSTTRFCTSDHKRDQIAKVMTALVRCEGFTDQPARMLNCLGIRADEGHERAKKNPFQRDKRASNGKRTVDTYFPIFDWSTAQVWARIHEQRLPYHWAYDAGMGRLSCCFCVFATRADLVLSARLNPELAREYAAVEARIGHTFTARLSMAQVVEEAQALGPLAPPIQLPQLV